MAMRVLVVDKEGARAAVVAEGLGADHQIRQAKDFDGAEVRTFAPDLVVLVADHIGRPTLQSLCAACEPAPVVIFVDRSEPGLAEAAVEAGVAAYVVDGLSAARVRPILDVAISRALTFRNLRAELAKAQADLTARKTIDRAKGLLMKERGLDEAAAYAALRKLAMDSGRPLGAVAADLLAFAGLLKGDKA